MGSEQIMKTIQMARNYAKDISSIKIYPLTARQHIFGLCQLIESAHARYAKSHEALEQELSVMHATVASYRSPAEALKALIDWHVQVALDPKVNGGKVLIDEGELSGLHAACASLSETIYCLQEK